MKELNLLQIAEYTLVMCIDHRSYLWLVGAREAEEALVNKHSAKYLKHTHKCGIECPKIVDNALELDADAIVKEMKNV